MTDQSGSGVEESLSALMDGEATELEVRRVLKSLPSDAELRDKWRRYHMTASAIRQELPLGTVDLSTQIGCAIEDETTYSPARWSQSLSKVAVAASVAVVAVFGVQQLRQGSIDPDRVNLEVAAVTPAVQPVVAGPEDSGPRFQLPSGFEMPQVTARTVSTGPAPMQRGYDTRYQPLENSAELDTHRQIERYIYGLLARHAEQASLRGNQRVVSPTHRPREQAEQ